MREMSYEAEFEALIDHLKAVIEDIETIHNARELIYKLKLDTLDLLKIIMSHAEMEAVDLPPSIYNNIPEVKGKEVESVSLDHSGILVVKKKMGEGRKSDISSFHEAKTLPTGQFITVFNAVIPILRKNLSSQRKLHEKQLEALQAIKENLSVIEKRRKL
jgi:hypothetical protein